MNRSAQLFRRAQELMPGGVNSPVRAFRSVGGQPVFIAKARGATVTDADGKTYIDYVGSWGPMIAGHAHPRAVAAVARAAKLGTSYGASTEAEITLAEMVAIRTKPGRGSSARITTRSTMARCISSPWTT